MVEVFDYSNYKDFLRESIRRKPAGGRGMRLAIAKAIRCQISYVSQVLNGDAEFSSEQAEALSRYLNFTEEETKFFLLLVQRSRAGTRNLRKFYDLQIKSEKSRRLILKNRLKIKRSLDESARATYYSSWHYSAVHVLLSIPRFQTVSAISEKLNLAPDRVEGILRFLNSVGLATESEGSYKIGTTHVHLADDESMISKHHSNWRMKAIQAVDNGSPDGLHYSSVVTLSRSDANRLKSQIVKFIENSKTLIKDSREETVRCLSVDYFGL